MIYFLKQIKDFLGFFKDVIASRALIYELTKQDFRFQYLGSYLGLVWSFVNPAITIFIFWFVFHVGFKSSPVAGFPFVLWLVAGMIPWFFFSDSVMKSTKSVMEKSFLVKKISFRVSMLPIIKILSALVIHVFFLGILSVLFMVHGYPLSIYTIQIFYYLVAMVVLLLGLSWLTSSIVLFIRDVEHGIATGVQFLFWLTPVFWSVTMLPERYQRLIKLNPVYYVVQGYRDAFIHHVWFWQHPGQTLYFWTLAGVVFVMGALLFRRLKPHFADVL